ncbi:unnamed protein product [Kuraishia capsulata CBS 1993]|uniref:ISWI chromatin-remodeling complex ATPase ISW2 n=1 Tax=Kuraishia capsulata CBS 1993 TaxID=1382522 RepID=W6MFF9_9ASCO|nr:uncharacterized protein KUCA_T00000276001 [Kuraishia capsulata CBS 1993]CDK24316.1 unnamed protein product [Kuraishia capsulata CBS 1993]
MNQENAVDTSQSTSRFETPEYDLSGFAGYNKQISVADRKLKYIVRDEKQAFNVEETAKRFSYLLGLTTLFKHFINSKAEKDSRFRQVLDLIQSDNRYRPNRDGNDHRRRKTEKEEDAELLNEGQDDEIFEFNESPGYVDGELRPYQIQGLNWLISLYQNHLSGILADEMGLGKTLQTISFLGYLRYIRCVPGPHLVVVPKSTLDNWRREFNKWTPEVNVLVLQGDKQERDDLIKNRLMTCDFDVVISSYEIVIREKSSFRKFNWEYIVIDEAHRIKNEESLLSQIIRMFHSKQRLLITGTPLQNNLHELWALLNFILPDVFADSETFDEWFQSSGKVENGEESEARNEDSDQGSVVQQLHKVLQPFLLRRIKSDVEKSLLPKKEVNVYLGMTEMQRQWYQSILEKDIDAVNGANGKRESKTRLLNIVMQLRKCCNHPYLFEGAEPGPPYTTDEHLVYNSQKLKVLDKLLKKFKEEGSRVLIFSQMSRMLDILEDYCVFRDYEYCRIDGQTDHADRIQAIDNYNAPDSEKFVFLLTTRAGGLGINLTTADIVVLFDSDWNPQADLQAMDRAHRIGQTKQVKVFRFVTENAIEEKVIERASQKLRLDQLVIQQGRNSGGISNELQQKAKQASSKEELLSMIQHGAAAVFQEGKKDEKTTIDDDEIDAILKSSEERTAVLQSRFASLGLDDLQNFTTNDSSVYEWDGKNYSKKPVSNGAISLAWINPAKRERKENYSVDMYYKGVLHTGGRTTAKSGPRPPKQLNTFDHQFYPARLSEIYDLEKAYFKKQTKYKPVLSDSKHLTQKQKQADLRLEELEIEHSRPLTEEEEAEKQELANEGYSNWSRRDFTHFIHLCAKYGRDSFEEIASEFEDKTIEDVKEYSEVFWENYGQIDGHERYISQIEQGEEKLAIKRVQKQALRHKLSQYHFPLQELVLEYPPATTNRRIFSEEEDRFLLVQLYRFGSDREDTFELIQKEIFKSPQFQFDFFFQSRSISELSRRCTTLLTCLLREYEPGTKKTKSKKPTKKRKPVKAAKNAKRQKR